MTFRVFLTLFLALLLSAGCGRKKAPETEPELSQPVQGGAIAGNSADYTEPLNYVQGVGIHARAEGPIIVISAANRSNQTIDVIYRDLALIHGPNRGDLLPVTASIASVREFTPLRLSPGQRAVTRLRITHPFQTLRGLRLVYNNPRNRILSYADIQ